MKFVIRYYRLEGQRTSPVVEAIDAVPAKFRAAILSDIELVGEYGFSAPVSLRSVKGHTPMVEIRTGAYRTFFVVDRGELWVLGCVKKQDQDRGIESAAKRMRVILDR